MRNFQYGLIILIFFWQTTVTVAQSTPAQYPPMEILKKQGMEAWRQQNWPEAIKYYKQALFIAKKSSNKARIAYYLYGLGSFHLNLNKDEEGLRYFQKIVEMDLKLPKDIEYKVQALYQMGDVYKYSSRYHKAIKSYLKALALDPTPTKDIASIYTLDNLGDLFLAVGNVKQSIFYYLEGQRYHLEQGDLNRVARSYSKLGELYKYRGNYALALKNFQYANDIYQTLKRNFDILSNLQLIADIYQDQGNLAKALQAYQNNLELAKKYQLKHHIFKSLFSTGQLYETQGRYPLALNYYQQSLKIGKTMQSGWYKAQVEGFMGQLYMNWGRMDQALIYFQKGHQYHLKNNKKTMIANDFNAMGFVYFFEGKLQEALKYYKKALKISKEVGYPYNIANYQKNVAMIYTAMGDFSQALKYYQQALTIFKTLNRKANIAHILKRIGLIHQRKGQYEKDLDYQLRALKIHQQLNHPRLIASSLTGLAYHYRHVKKQNKLAYSYLKQALDIYKKLNIKHNISNTLSDLGQDYLDDKQYNQAVNYLKQSIKIVEEQRKKTPPENRREAFAMDIHKYRSLLNTQYKRRDFNEVLSTMEQSKARLMLDKLAGLEPAYPLQQTIQSQLAEDTAILNYQELNWKEGYVQLLISQKQFSAIQLLPEKILQPTPLVKPVETKTLLAKARGIKLVHQETSAHSDFQAKIQRYRKLLSHPDSDKKQLKTLAHKLYKVLIQPIKDKIKNQSKLVIIPDGTLGYLPFETLIDEQGKYLMENYQISYIQSLAVREEIKKRKYAQSTQKPLLAFGGAIYEPIDYQGYKVDPNNSKQKRALLQEIHARPRSMRSIYGSIQLNQWEPLPGTLSEVNSLKTLFVASDIITGEKVNETYLKELSQSGQLAKYKVIHFATHGLVKPDLPELSALILSQTKDEKKDDGFLRMEEIEQLQLKAQFVNLSACETGLGKLYEGEGVVGLAQSFLIAGAKGVSSSLWQVADDSTATFMKNFYKEKGSYKHKLHQMKLRFLNGEFGEAYRHPYYWAPFVYYGD